MKRICCYITLFITLVGFSQTEVWVAPNGDDTNKGTKNEPVQHIDIAIRKVRDLRRLNDTSVAHGAIIHVAKGTYFLEQSIVFRHEDSGTEQSPTILQGDCDGETVISGGIPVTGWKKFSGNLKGLAKKAKQNLWVADIPIVNGAYLNFRQLWVNDVKATRASNLDAPQLDRILAANHTEQYFDIPKPEQKFHDTDQLEMVIHQWWAIANLRVKEISYKDDKAEVRIMAPESQIEFEHPWPAPFIDAKNEYNGNSAYYWVGAIELLDHPGEWFADFKQGKLYYWPRATENMKSAEAIVPYLETLLAVKGNKDLPVSHITIENIEFNHATWLRPSQMGHVPLQAGFYITEAYKLKDPGTALKPKLENQAWLGRQGAAVTVENSNNLTITNCVVQHVAATGIDLISGADNVSVTANLVTDAGGTAIQAGFFGSDDFEAHLPYDPTDERELVKNITIENNLIQNATNEDWGCVGIGVGFAQNVLIAHNDISDLNYTGISLGWGWTKTVNCLNNNRVFGNKIHRFARQMYDVAGVYTLSAQPNTVIAENAIFDLLDAPYAHMPHHHQYIYLDEGSSYMRIENNWSEKDIFFCNANGPGNEWENNGSKVSETIKENAGLTKDFQYLFEKLEE